MRPKLRHYYRHKVVGLYDLIHAALHLISRCRLHCGLPRGFPRTNKGTIIRKVSYPVTWWVNGFYQSVLKVYAPVN